MKATTLIADPAALRVADVSLNDGVVAVRAAPRRRTADCPLCHRRTRRIHSRYWRTVRDLPCGGVPVVLRLRVRRFVCRNRRCPREIFCERLPSLTRPYGRHTLRLEGALQHVGLVLGGEPGARPAPHLGLPTSSATLLRLVRRTAAPVRGPVRVLGVDDWARRKGRSYGTILVDLERHRPVALLPDRSAAEFAAWLRAHPGVQIVSRDRGKEYAEGARQGAPEAVHVADRWHVLENLGDALERLLARKPGWLREAAVVRDRSDGQPQWPEFRLLHLPTAAERDRAARRVRRLARYEAVKALRERGLSISTIARQVGLARNTVLGYVRADGFPERAPRRPGPASLARHEAYLRQRWDAGCHNAQQLWREIQARGYPGSALTVRRGIARWQAEGILAPGEVSTETRPPIQPLAPRHGAWLLTQPVEALDPEEAATLQRLRGIDAGAEAAYASAQEFRRLVRERDPEALGAWLQAARASDLPELRGFAEHLQRDRAAVGAALSLPWSNGQTEGQITRLKLIKRQMYGRAKLDLLRCRVLYRG